jgi:hypothetical protein
VLFPTETVPDMVFLCVSSQLTCRFPHEVSVKLSVSHLTCRATAHLLFVVAADSAQLALSR